MTHYSQERLEALRSFLERHGVLTESLDLVAQAMTHRSWSFENGEVPDNERLEFLGDAVLGALTAEHLYKRYPDEDEGCLSRRKAFLVSRRALGRRAQEMGLADLLLLGRGEEETGGRSRSSTLGGALEAILGALYMIEPLETVRRLVVNSIVEPGLQESGMDSGGQDDKSRLQEWLQARGRPLPEYRKVREEGPAHERFFVVEVWVEGGVLGAGEGARLKTAESLAARHAYETLLESEESD